MLDCIRKFENVHIVLWLLKDSCWAMDWRAAGMVMVVPTIAMAIYISWLSRSALKELIHNLAVCSWILANSIWMIGEFFFDDNTRPFSLVFFILGLGLIAAYHLRTWFVRRQSVS
jgi:hypothetical protein